MNSAYSPNSQPRIPAWVCQGRVVTTDLTTLGTNPNSKQHESATQEAKDLGNLWCLGQTVRGDWADGPQGHVGRSAKAARTIGEKRTVLYPTRGQSLGNLYHANCARQAGGLSTNHSQLKATFLMDRTMNAHEQAKNWRNTRPRELSVPTRWTVCVVRTEQLEPELLKVNTSFPLPDLPNQPRGCYQITSEDEASLGGAILTNL
jgi:hypothetical protein